LEQKRLHTKRSRDGHVTNSGRRPDKLVHFIPNLADFGLKIRQNNAFMGVCKKSRVENNINLLSGWA